MLDIVVTGDMSGHQPGHHAIRRYPVEQLVETVINGTAPRGELHRDIGDLAQQVVRMDVSGVHLVVLGGGTGLSTVVGGNSQMPDWLDHPFLGLKQEFPNLDVIVCTTDDGGSTGLLLKQLPMIGIGDLRKSCLSLVRSDLLQRTYRLGNEEVYEVIRIIQRVFIHRFAGTSGDARMVREPLLAIPLKLRKVCPERLAVGLRELGGYVSQGGKGPTLNSGGHCLGNLLLTAAIFRAAHGRTGQAPNIAEVRAGIDAVCKLIGTAPGRLHPATITPGQLKLRYTNGVEVYGQSKSARVRRGCPVERVVTEFIGKPEMSPAVTRAIREADVIVFAPGSLYTSMIPILQIRAITEAIRRNRQALKILAANFWVQAGETDISPENEGREFLVSELIEAYDRNVPGGAQGLFNVVLSANLENIPGNILRNYALEGKRHIHLDRSRVEAMGIQPIEATLFSPDQIRSSRGIRHDAAKFSLAVRALFGARHFLNAFSTAPRCQWVTARRPPNASKNVQKCMLCHYVVSIDKALKHKHFHPSMLKQVMRDLAWDNRDIQPAHLGFFDRVQMIPASRWNRSTEWDNVLGYYNPEDRCLKVHEHLVTRPARLREDLLIALGESLLGNYIEERRWIVAPSGGLRDARCFEIRIRPAQTRQSFLNDAQLRSYLRLARMVPDRRDPCVFRITINNHEGFLPPGLLFGLLYAWYLNNAYGGIMEYEMSLLKWPPHSLIPHQAKERIRKQALVKFFCHEIFGHKPATSFGV